MIASLFRFHGHNSLRYVYSRGQAVRSQLLTIKWVPNTRRQHPRVSVVVSKKISKRAVDRNRLRRRLYEYMRTQLDHLTGPYDIVLITTSQDLITLPYNEISQHIEQLLKKAELLK